MLETLARAQALESSYKHTVGVARVGAKLTTSLLERVVAQSTGSPTGPLRTGIEILLAMRSQVRLANHWRNSYTARATT
jgi:hypothetical protein